MTTTLHVIRGLPGSGKTTLRNELVAKNPGTVGISRDDLRAKRLITGGVGSIEEERDISRQLTRTVRAVLQGELDVVVDNQHLRDREVKHWVQVAQSVGAQVQVHDLRDVPVEVCVSRIAQRVAAGGRSVPADYIRQQWTKRVQGRDLTPRNWNEQATTFAPLEQDIADGRPFGFIVDVDGTLALSGDRNPYDTAKAQEDRLQEHVALVVDGLAQAGLHVLVATGRSTEHLHLTKTWLNANGIPYTDIKCRADGDNRDDAIVKSEILDEFAKEYHILGAIDDRPKVCRMWRKRGIPTLQVGDPDIEF